MHAGPPVVEHLGQLAGMALHKGGIPHYLIFTSICSLKINIILYLSTDLFCKTIILEYYNWYGNMAIGLVKFNFRISIERNILHLRLAFLRFSTSTTSTHFNQG